MPHARVYVFRVVRRLRSLWPGWAGLTRPCVPEASSPSGSLVRIFSSSSAGVALGQTINVDAGMDRIPELPAKTLARLLAQPGALDARGFTAAVECALQRVEEMDGKDCVRVLRALTHIHIEPDENSLRALGVRLGERLRELSSADMAHLAEDLANASLTDVPIFSRLSVAFSLRSAGATAPQLAKMAVAFSHVRLIDRRLFPRLAQSAIKQLHAFAVPDLAAFLAAFATVGICHEALLTASAKVVAMRARGMSALDLALVAFAYAQFFLVFPVVVAVLRRRLPECANELPPVRLAELVVSCARLAISETPLSSTFALRLEFSGLSAQLFGQVSNSLASLGLVSSPGLQKQLIDECNLRLGDVGIYQVPRASAWILDLVDCLGEAAQDARQRHGGATPPFLPVAWQLAAPPLAELCPSLGPTEAASLYRCLRELPPSLVNMRDGTYVWPVHEALAVRAAGLARAQAFSYMELTSTLFSAMCLYPQLWSESDVYGPVNPQWQALRQTWEVLSETWAVAPCVLDDSRTERQVAALLLLLPGGAGSAAAHARVAKAERNRPVAIELLGILQGLGHKAHGPVWEGGLELNAVVGSRAFCVMAEDMYFRCQVGAAFEEPPASTTDGGGPFSKQFELCLEKAAEVQLLQRRGWHVVSVPFYYWRGLNLEERLRFMAEAATGCG